MTTNAYRLYRASADASLTTAQVAAAPSNGTYVVEGGAVDTFHVVRVDSAGAFVWNKEVVIPDSTSGVTPSIASSANNVVVFATYIDDAFFTFEGAVLCYSAAGTLLWEKKLSNVQGRGFVTVGPDDSVYINAYNGDYDNTYLVKLNASTGAVTWDASLVPSGSSSDSSDRTCPMAALSGGDIVMFARGEFTGDTVGFLQRVSATDGSVVWSRSIDWDSTGSGSTVGVDPSDNIYVIGPQNAPVSTFELPVLKFDSSGTELWNIILKKPTTFSGYLNFSISAGPLFADATGVYMVSPIARTGVDVSKPAHLFVPAAGTTGALNIPVSIYDGSVEATASSMTASGGQTALLSFAGTGTYDYIVVLRTDYTTVADDNAYGAHERDSFLYDSDTGTATVATATYTRSSAPGLSTSSITTTQNTGDLSIEVLGPTIPPTVAAATGIASTVSFGTTITPGGVQPYTTSTAFGTAKNRRIQSATGTESTAVVGSHTTLFRYNATGAASTLALGEHTYNLDLSYGATALAAGTEFGEAWANRTGPAAPKVASSVPRTLAFGLPVAAGLNQCTTAGASTSAFGTPSALYGLGATGLASAADFGTAVLTSRRGATGLRSTEFGTPAILSTAYPAAWTVSTRFGSAYVEWFNAGGMSGISGTTFGTPSVIASRQAARALRARAVFGQAQAERTAP